MEDLKALLIEKTGIDEAAAEKVIGFLDENWDEVAKSIGGEKMEDLGEAVGDVIEDVKGKISGLFDKK